MAVKNQFKKMNQVVNSLLIEPSINEKSKSWGGYKLMPNTKEALNIKSQLWTKHVIIFHI